MRKQTFKDILLISLAVWIANLAQITLLANLNLFGGQPNLIAIGAIIFLMFSKFNLGLIWIGVGGIMFDTLLGAIGVTTLPLLIAYGLSYFLIRHLFNNLPWLISFLLGLFLLSASEIVLVFYYNHWEQLWRDLSFGGIILAPLTFYIKDQYLRKNTA